jgi:hypothetical protein
LEWIFKATGWEAVDWLHLAENRDQWLSLVNTVIEQFRNLTEWLLASEETLCFLELVTYMTSQIKTPYRLLDFDTVTRAYSSHFSELRASCCRQFSVV